jgi:hypothetical protein
VQGIGFVKAENNFILKESPAFENKNCPAFCGTVF